MTSLRVSLQFKKILEPEIMADDFSQPRLKRLRLVSRGAPVQSELHADCGTRVEPVPSRRVVLVPGSPDDTPRSIQDRSCASNRFSVLAESDAEDGQPQHHDIGTPPPTADEGDIENNDTASLVGQIPSREGPRRQDTDESHSGEENQNCDAMSESDTASVMWQGSEVSTDDIPVPLSEPDVDVRGAHAGSPEIRAAFVFLDTIDLRTTFARRASVMKSIPHWLKGPFRNALKLAMEEAIRPGVLHQERGWKLFLLIPRLLLHRPPRGGLVPKSKLVQRFDDFARGDWEKLFQSSDKCDEEASRAYTRRGDGRSQKTTHEERHAHWHWCRWANCQRVVRLWKERIWLLATWRHCGSCATL